MVKETASKACHFCNKAIRGRADKKFCSDFCRNNYNNQLKSRTNNHVRNINNALSKNRRILEDMLAGNRGTAKTTKERLLQSGFQFRYITHTYQNPEGNIYFFCYEYGYLPLENNWYLVVKGRE